MNLMQQVVNGILVVNTETIPGKIITETMGVVSGSTVRAKNCLLYTSDAADEP